jgi:hypothetical protein
LGKYNLAGGHAPSLTPFQINIVITPFTSQNTQVNRTVVV